MKYIVDVPDEAVGFMDGEMSFFVEPKIKDERRRHYVLRIDEEDVSIYTEPDRKAIEDEVWDFVKKIEYLTVGETEDCFDVEYDGIPFVANMFSYQEAKAKYEAWKKKGVIHVGDEIMSVEDDVKAVMLDCADYESIYVMTEHGCVERWKDLDGVKKTGRTFPEVAELLQKMRGEEE